MQFEHIFFHGVEFLQGYILGVRSKVCSDFLGLCWCHEQQISLKQDCKIIDIMDSPVKVRMNAVLSEVPGEILNYLVTISAPSFY